jgi:hypothetical protein
MKSGLSAFSFFLVVLSHTGANGDIVTRCGHSVGHGFFLEGPIVGQRESGWRIDEISEGEILLSIENNGEIDIIVKDALSMRSSKSDGGRVFYGGGSEKELILVFYPDAGTLEHYIFSVDERGYGIVVWGTARAGGLIQKSNVMVAQCTAP